MEYPVSIALIAFQTIANTYINECRDGNFKNLITLIRMAASNKDVWQAYTVFKGSRAEADMAPLQAKLDIMNNRAQALANAITPTDLYISLKEHQMLDPLVALSRNWYKRAFAAVSNCGPYNYYLRDHCYDGDCWSSPCDEGAKEFIKSNELCYLAMKKVDLFPREGSLQDLAWYGSTFGGDVIVTVLEETGLVRNDISCDIYAKAIRDKSALATIIRKSGTRVTIDWLAKKLSKTELYHGMQDDHFVVDKPPEWWAEHVPKKEHYLESVLKRAGYLDACSAEELMKLPLPDETKYTILIGKKALVGGLDFQSIFKSAKWRTRAMNHADHPERQCSSVSIQVNDSCKMRRAKKLIGVS